MGRDFPGFPGTGREIENHIPVLREGNGNAQIATGREGKFEACNPGNPGKSRETYKKARLNSRLFSCPDKPSAAKAFLISVKMIFATGLGKRSKKTVKKRSG